MIKEYAKFEYNGLTIEANYSPDVVPCKRVRFTIGDTAVEIEHADFYAAMMLFGNEEEQEKLLKVTQTEMKGIQRMLQVKVKKDMKAGELIQFPYTYYVPKETFDELIKDQHYREAPEGTPDVVTHRPVSPEEVQASIDANS